MHLFTSLISTIACNCVNGAVAAYNAIGNKLYWFHSLVFSVITTFGGGFIAPMLMGKPAQALNNDVIIFCCIASWFVVHYCRGHEWLQYLPIKMFWMCFLGIFRSNAVTNIVATANSIFAKSAYYPIPIFGPIITGTVLGGMGQFLPFDKGLVAISKGTPWNIQGAFYTASFYHFMVNDKEGWIGQMFRSVFGSHSPASVVMMIAAMQVIQLELHALCTPEANLFAPIHSLLYAIIPVNGPTPKPVDAQTPLAGWNRQARARLATLIDLGRLVLVMGTLMIHFHYFSMPPAVKTIHTVDDLSLLNRRNTFGVNTTVMGSCQWLSSLRSCQPFVLRFEEKDNHLYLNTYSAVVGRNDDNVSSEGLGPIQQSLALSNSKESSSWRLAFVDTGDVLLYNPLDNDASTLNHKLLAVNGLWKNSPYVQLDFNFKSGSISHPTLADNHSESQDITATNDEL
jgi:hypothetical protein